MNDGGEPSGEHGVVRVPERRHMDDRTRHYRGELLQLQAGSQRDYDKTVVSLSGGALGVSLVFLDRVLGPGGDMHLGWVMGAWAGWGLSVATVLVSHWLSVRALEQCVGHIDREGSTDDLDHGALGVGLKRANLLSGASFLAGLLLMAVFVYQHRS